MTVQLQRLAALEVRFVATTAAADTDVRIATDNIKFLDADALPDQVDRTQKLQEALDLSHADVIGFQEITALLPNPQRIDRGHEAIHLRNDGATDVDLAGWSFRDRAENTYRIASGTIAAGADLIIVMQTFDMPLNNAGDDILLFDADGVLVDSASYSTADVAPGRLVELR